MTASPVRMAALAADTIARLEEHEPVRDYRVLGLKIWARRMIDDGCGRTCPCIVCADVRRFLGMEPLS